MAKELLYRDPLYHDTVNAGADPFTAVYAPAGTTSLVTIPAAPPSSQ